MEHFDFTEDEIREQLELLGYRDIPPERLREFKKDLEQLVQHEQSQASSMSSEAPAHNRGDTPSPTSYIPPPQQPQQPPQHSQHYYKQQVAPPPVQFSRPPVQIPTERPGLQRALSDTTLDTSTASSGSRRLVKRKVLRKVDGHSQIFDESSYTESETGDELGELEHRLRTMGVRSHYATRPSTAPEHRAKWHVRPTSAEPAYRLSEDYEGPKALIRPMSKEPHKQNLHKCDPVSRYQKYSSSWKAQKAPGERAHSNLRWSVREHMLYHDQVVSKKQRPVTTPNDYKVPTEKKRKALRWQVRHDLAQGLLPPSILD